MKPFPGEFFQCIPVGTEHVDPPFHLLYFTAVLSYLLPLGGYFKPGLYPAADIVAGTERQNEKRHGRNRRCENEETAMFSRKQLSDLSQFVNDKRWNISDSAQN